jgi:hypothetical protein
LQRLVSGHALHELSDDDAAISMVVSKRDQLVQPMLEVLPSSVVPGVACAETRFGADPLNQRVADGHGLFVRIDESVLELLSRPEARELHADGLVLIPSALGLLG